VPLIRIQLRYADGKQEELAIEAERALIGSGAHCEVRLPADAARVEHVAVQLTPTGVFAQALTFDPPPMVSGLPFTQGALLPDTALVVGNVEIYVQSSEAKTAGSVVRTSSQKSSPLTLVLLALLIPLGAYVLLMDDEQSGIAEPPKKVPALWEAGALGCPQKNETQALATANERVALADTKRERSPFDVKEGVMAVPLYEVAAACYKVAGDARSEEAKASAEAIRSKLSEDYRTHTVWLEHCLKAQDWRGAQREVALLLAFTEGKKGEYVTWLSNLDRQLRIKYGQRSP
jgi:hypothetical protein